MLHAAGTLTIDLAGSLLPEGRGLKDATPHNILFRGPRPVFVDVLSFEPRKPLDPVWLAAAQFSRTFTLPLLANRVLGLPLDQIFRTRRDGLTPLELRKWTHGFRAYLPPLLGAVTLPALLSKFERPGLYVPRQSGSDDEAQFILSRQFRRLQKQLGSPPQAAHSGWSQYQDQRPSYTPAESEAKRNFVRRALERARPRRVLDAGSNTGEYALLAAQGNSKDGPAEVVAIDVDPSSVGQLWRRAKESNANILPLVVDLARPSPPLGWRNVEQSSFLDRARGKFDCVLMLALVHHLLVNERVPLSEIFRLAAELSTGSLIIEYVGPGDPMFQKIARGRDWLHADLTPAVFEREAERWFHIADSFASPNSHRKLYWMERV
jgi:SAM-dependent methyltransferase